MQAVIPYLLDMGHEVIGVDNYYRYGRLERRRVYEFVEGDLCDRVVVARVMKGVDYVFQGAARIYGVRGFHEYAADILSYDVILHANILHEAVTQAVRKVVYTSSSMVYEGEGADRVPHREENVATAAPPSTDYGLSKLVCERMCEAFDQQYNLNYTLWRPFNIISPVEKGEKEPGLSHVFADLIRKIVIEQQNPVEIFGDGEQIRCFTWIEDVACAIAQFSFSPDSDRNAFNLGNPEPVTMRELAHRIYSKAKAMGAIISDRELEFIHKDIYSDDVRFRIPSIEKANKVFGFKPTFNLDQALDKCLQEAVTVYKEQKAG